MKKKKKALITGLTGQDGSYLAELLLEKEVIFKDDLQEIFGKRPFDTEIEEVKTEEVKTPEVDKISEE